MSITILEGDCLKSLATLDAGIVQTCVTSPPYYGLRDYGVGGQIGLEETPDLYIDKLVAVFREVRRVLADDGTLWLNLGDSYWANRSTNGEAGGEGETALAGRVNQTRAGGKSHATIKPKDLIGIPWMVAFALRADGWYLRSEIIWHKPNPMPESVTDRPTKAHEQIFLLSKSAHYFYDAEAIKEPASYNTHARVSRARLNHKSMPNEKRNGIRPRKVAEPGSGIKSNTSFEAALVNLVDYRNKRDVWTVNSHPYKEAHFATFPVKLIEPCILAGSREGDTVLDPFNGSGTTGAVAIKHHRNYIGCELNPDYIELTRRRFARVQPVLFPPS